MPGKLSCNYPRYLLDALAWAHKMGPDCVGSLLDQLTYLDDLPQFKSVVKVALGPGVYRTKPGSSPHLCWAGYSEDDGTHWTKRQVIAGSLDYSTATGQWSVNT